MRIFGTFALRYFNSDPTDSGASRHISYRREWFNDLTPRNGGTVVLGNNGRCEVKDEGVIRVAKFVDGRWRESRIEGILYVPNLRKNLFSVGMCTKKGFDIKFDKERVTVMRGNEIAAIRAKQSNEIVGFR